MKPGYKQTDAGIIPISWSENTVGQLIEFQGGSQPAKSVFSASPRPGYVRLIQIRDYKSDRFEVFAPAALLRRFCDENDIMIGRYGPPVFQILRGISGAYNVALIKANPRPGIDRDFAFYFLKQDSLFEFIDKLSRRSSGQTGVDLTELRGYPLPLPPLPEQRAIAEALSDVDGLLGALDRLIAKKRDLKQAAMQQLLTGQTRLPGFHGEWEVKRLGDVGSCLRGVAYQGDSDLSANDTPHTKRLLRSNNVQDAIVVTDELQFVNAERVSEHQILRNGDVLICMANGSKALVGKAGFFAITDGYEYTFGAFMGCFRANLANASSAFTFYLFQTGGYRRYIGNLLAGSSINNLSPSSIESLEFSMPPLPEQTAIAQVLTDMDAELAALQQRRDKTRVIKQGMMQQLLTGKTRLV